MSALSVSSGGSTSTSDLEEETTIFHPIVNPWQPLTPLYTYFLEMGRGKKRYCLIFLSYCSGMLIQKVKVQELFIKHAINTKCFLHRYCPEAA